MREIRNSYKILIENCQSMISLGVDKEDNAKMNITEIVWTGFSWFRKGSTIGEVTIFVIISINDCLL
jgi:hypothetical protein